ncbi:MAG: AAA family ATPase [Planctomycetes bacterium]|nr:AAA family ATPase [Planctomycetota bacterium]
MYEQYWGLNRNPFANNTEAEFFFRSATHQAALLKMRYVVENRLGAGLLTGGIGYGKSYLVRMLAEELPDQFGPVVHLVFPQLTATELLSWIAVELGVDESELSAGTGGADRTIRRIQRQLRNYAETHRYPVLVIDEAHLIEDRQVFQALQLLLNFQQQPDIDFTLFFIGERSLSSRINRMAQLDERIAVKSALQPLSEEETVGYVEQRLKVAGATRPCFDEQALQSVIEFSGGVPRRINRLCDLALLIGFADQLDIVTEQEIIAAAEEQMAATAA